ncbi:LysR family transcriptional regulator, partial [Comamonas thiooxydans]|uniref:LysR family transcriptional regulator n=1 Tax=Comamonas thiooxydans TaxID=363952 RepID=UPI00325FD385
MKLPDLNELYYFAQVVEHGGFAPAGRALGLPKSKLSRRVALGYSQHAHLNYGKGLGLKTDDRTGFPLCCSRPGIEGCHVA